MRDRTIYIVVTRTNTIPSRAIRIYTGCPYNHVSLSIDSRLEDMVSFGRLYPSMPMPGGFVHEGKNKGFFRRFRDTHCRVYSKKIGEWEYQKFLHLLHSHNFKLRTYFKRYYDEQKGLYEVHQYMIAQKWTQLPGMLYRQVRGDCVYIRQQPLSKKEKIHWAFYSLFRNFDRFVGGYLGGKYHLYSKRKQQFLDRHISQQYDQRHA